MVNYNINYLKPNNQKSFLNRDYDVYSFKKLNAPIYKNAFILPYKETNDPYHIYAGVVTENGEYLDQSGFHEDIGKGYSFSEDGISSINICIYLGVFDNCWGHVITDVIKKVWYVNNFNIKENVIYAYTTRLNKPLANHTIEILSLAGIDIKRCVHIQKITKVNTLLLPDNSLFLNQDQRFYTNEYKETINKIKLSVQAKFTLKEPKYKKIYFTRTKLNDWRDHGEHSIEKEFSKKGFQIIAPEELSPSKQIYLLMNCEEFATLSGSPAHSAQFCSKGTKFIDIRKADYWNTYQEVANHLGDLNVTLIDTHKSTMVKSNAPWGGPFYIYKTPEFLRFIQKPPFIIPLLLRPSWLQYRYKEPLKDIYYGFRARIGIRTNINKIYNYIKFHLLKQ